ncbi:MAG: hypothetical protein BHW65_01510 [Verrucomicrobia bacterium CAG:312_58_20]|nr:MAG: hypothetical protein BHW65_01510 [Verrucomicrobia bacterium CAG:312_58_20]
MKFLVNLAVSAARMGVGAALLILAAGIPAYFFECDRRTVAAAGEGTPSPLDIAGIYLDASKISTASLIAKESGTFGEISEAVEKQYSAHPQWVAAGGNEPFFEAYYSSVPETPARMSPAPLYSVLAASDSRKKLLDFLAQADSGLVKKFISMRGMNPAIFPPVYSSAGAPLEAALLINALMAQAGDFDRRFLLDIASIMDLSEKSPEKKEEFEKYCLATLAFAKGYDWTIVRSIFSHFSSAGEAYGFARVYESAPTRDYKNVLLAGMFECGSPSMCSRYLDGADPRRWEDFRYAFLHGEGALAFLLESGSPIYSDSAFARFLSPVCSPIKEALAPYVAKFPAAALSAKVALAVIGGYFFIRGFLRIFQPERDTPSWHSPLALTRGLLEALAAALVFFLLAEPNAFAANSVENAPAPELRFAFEKVINTIGEETMNFETDTATIAAVALFFVLQLTVYVFCLIRLSMIKRIKAPAKLKMQLLENEETLFDLGLYIGLGGTVFSLILLTMGIVTASLMAAYASTLFGILFTALVKTMHVRRYKRRLLLEAANE